MAPSSPARALRRDDSTDDMTRHSGDSPRQRGFGDNFNPRGGSLAAASNSNLDEASSGSRGIPRTQTPLSFLSLADSTFTPLSSNRSESASSSGFQFVGGSVNSDEEQEQDQEHGAEDENSSTSNRHSPRHTTTGNNNTGKSPRSWNTHRRSLFSSITAMNLATAAGSITTTEPEAVSISKAQLVFNSGRASGSASTRATAAAAENNTDDSTAANAPRKSVDAEKGQYELSAPISPTSNSDACNNEHIANANHSLPISSPSAVSPSHESLLVGGVEEHPQNRTPGSASSTTDSRDEITTCGLPSHEQDTRTTRLRQHHLSLISEDQPSPFTQPPQTGADALSSPPHSPSSPKTTTTTTTSFTHSNSNHTTTEGGIIRPLVQRPVPHPLPPLPTSQSPTSSPAGAARRPSTIVRTASVHSVLRHPIPDINARSGSYTSNIANLEATAELFSMTSSIEDAIRDAHDELKRSDSRRSSILAASVRSGGDHSDGGQQVSAHTQPFVVRQSSIVGLNNTARFGGYSPAGYIMSPSNSLSSRLRSSSKGAGPLSRASSTRSRSEQAEGEGFPVLSRTGPGRDSMRSVHSNRSAPLSLAEITEMEPPSALTHEAMEEVDQGAVKGSDAEDEEAAILARAYQHVEPDATDIEVDMDRASFVEEDWVKTPVVGHSAAAETYWEDHEQPSLQLHNPQDPPSTRDSYQPPVEQRPPPTSHTSDPDNETDAFADFDGMHCDPDTVAEQFPFNPEESEYQPPVQRRSRMMQPPPVRPQSYFDPETNQQMLFYPARVPAMLNLPPKLGKGNKNTERNVRRSQILSQMPQTARESRSWLPDPLESEDAGTHFMGEDRPTSSQYSGIKGKGPEQALANLGENVEVTTPAVERQNEHPLTPEPLNLRRPAKLTDKRISRQALSELPPQLRASAFFELPRQAPKIEMKDGSAIATLDSILDASASAPVHAFTDHAFAGPLGSEVYGLDGKKGNRKSKLVLSSDASGDGAEKTDKGLAKGLAPPVLTKPKSMFSMFGRKSKSSTPKDEDSRSRISGSANEDRDSDDADEHSALAPSINEGSDDEEGDFDGKPTTLLAELQLRKMQHKNRTRGAHQKYPNGLHSTLLELDAVAQVEASARKGKKVNLAWTADTEEPESDDDEDVPLGLLAAKKRMGPDATERDVAIAAAEINRPLGLMEKREMEDNEPLSRRRDRLQGRPMAASMYLQPGSSGTRMTLGPGDANGSRFLRPMNSSGSLRPVSPLNGSGSHSRNGSMNSQTPDVEVEGETLGERMKRLRANDDDNPLPSARPVSMAFTSELMSQFGDLDEDKEKEAADKGKGKENAAPLNEEEETLGQRRRRLQAEREAREQEMASGGNADDGPVERRHNLASVLNAAPLNSAMGRMDPREAERRRKEVEGTRAQREADAKMAAFRAKVPTTLGDPKGGRVKSGGYMGGKFNDNAGGTIGLGLGLGQGHGHRQSHGVRPSASMGQMGQMGQLSQQQVYAGMNGQNSWANRSSANLIGAAGSYGNPNMGPHGQQNAMFVSQNSFGMGHNGGLLQQMQPQQPSPFANGSLLAMGGYGGGAAFGGGIGAAGGYAVNQTAYGAGVSYAAPNGMMFQQQPQTQAHLDQVERWRQSIQLNQGARHV